MWQIHIGQSDRVMELGKVMQQLYRSGRKKRIRCELGGGIGGWLRDCTFRDRTRKLGLLGTNTREVGRQGPILSDKGGAARTPPVPQSRLRPSQLYSPRTTYRAALRRTQGCSTSGTMAPTSSLSTYQPISCAVWCDGSG